MIPSVLAAARQVLSPALRRILLRALGLTVLLLLLAWAGLTYAARALIDLYPTGADYPFLHGLAVFLAGAGLFVGFAYILPVVSAIVAGFFLDEAAAVVEATDFPADPPGRPLSFGAGALAAVKFGLLALAVNAVALLLLLVPGVNVLSFFVANAYLFGREYFELAAARFRPEADATALRRQHRLTVMAAGAVMAGLLLVPIVNLVTPIFGIALMVHLHKRLAPARIAARAPNGRIAR